MACCVVLCCVPVYYVVSGKAAELVGYVMRRYPLCNPMSFWPKPKLRCLLDLDEMLVKALILAGLACLRSSDKLTTC